jgi:hypothetical protein
VWIVSPSLSVASFPDDVNQGIKSTVGVRLRFSESGKSFFVSYLGIDHYGDLIVLLAHLSAGTQSSAHHQPGNTFKAIESLFSRHWLAFSQDVNSSY